MLMLKQILSLESAISFVCAGLLGSIFVSKTLFYNMADPKRNASLECLINTTCSSGDEKVEIFKSSLSVSKLGTWV